MTTARPLALALAAAAALAAAGAAPAAADTERSAHFRATISGTYVNEGTLTNRECFAFEDDEDAGRVELPPMTGRHGERTSFRATRSVLLGVSQTRGQRRIVAGGPPIPVRVRTTRTSELAEPTLVRGCQPGFTGRDRADCGTRTRRHRIGVFAPKGRPAISYGLSSRFTIQSFDDPFDCPYAEGSSWWGGSSGRGNGEAPVSAARLFDPGVRTVVVRGGVTRVNDAARPRDGWEARGRERLRWKLTLRRVG